MGEKDLSLIEKTAEHSQKAARLLRKSIRIHQLEKRGRIGTDAAMSAVIELNRQASEEIFKYIAAQKQFISEEENKLAEIKQKEFPE